MASYFIDHKNKIVEMNAYLRKLLFTFSLIYVVLITVVCNSVDKTAHDAANADTAVLMEQPQDHTQVNDTLNHEPVLQQTDSIPH